ncbi:MAG: hypothetical protein J2P25_00460 [Nocardiopsaceae bacterium]|nr:hypothetical protein [Nocardiopsaceae bacterium]
MHRLPVRVEDIALLGVRVAAYVVTDWAEHRRREAAGITAVTDPALLDRLLDLPIDVPVRDAVIWAEMAGQAPAIVERAGDGASVTRLLRSPLATEDVTISAAVGRELAAVQDVSLFAGFTRRWMVASCDQLPDVVQLEAKLCGVGVLGPEGKVVLPAAPPASVLIDKWSWLWRRRSTTAAGSLHGRVGLLGPRGSHGGRYEQRLSVRYLDCPAGGRSPG